MAGRKGVPQRTRFTKTPIAELLREFRIKHYLTQRDMAKILGVTFCSVNRWEAGATTPSLKSLRKISAIMNMHEKRRLNSQKEERQDDQPSIPSNG